MDQHVRAIQDLIRDLSNLRNHEERQALVAYRKGETEEAHYSDCRAEAYTEAIRLANNLLVRVNNG
jgi:hypothetical protein